MNNIKHVGRSVSHKQAGLHEREIAEFLGCYYGEGVAYLPKFGSKNMLSAANRLGFIDESGYITRMGRTLLARYF